MKKKSFASDFTWTRIIVTLSLRHCCHCRHRRRLHRKQIENFRIDRTLFWTMMIMMVTIYAKCNRQCVCFQPIRRSKIVSGFDV